MQNLWIYNDVDPSTLIVHGYIRLHVSSEVETNQSFEIPMEIWNRITEYYECEQIVFTSEATGGDGGRSFSYRNKKDDILRAINWGMHEYYDIESLFFKWVDFVGKKNQVKKICGRPISSKGLKLTQKPKTTKLIESGVEDEWCIGAYVHYGGVHDGIRSIEFISNKPIIKKKGKTGKVEIKDKLIEIGFNENERRKKKRYLKTKEIRMPTPWFKMVGITGSSGYLIDNIAFVFKGPKFLAERLKIKDYTKNTKKK